MVFVKLSEMNIRIGFIGAGSIGSLFGWYLASIKSEIYSTEVILFCRKDHSEAINKNGLMLGKQQIELNIRDIKAYDNPEGVEEIEFNFLFLTTKTYDMETAMEEYKELIEASNWVIILQNGIGNEETVKEYCFENKIIRIVTTNGALIKEPGYVIHTGKGMTKIGFPFQKNLDITSDESEDRDSDLKMLTDLLNLSGLETIIVEDIIKECWEKIFVNVGINAFGALTRLKNGELLENEGLKNLMGGAVNEAVKIAELKKINLSKKDFVALTYDVAEKTYENKNSMLQDVLKGKNTEIDFINGRIVKYAKELGLKVPINELLTYLIKGLEQSIN